MVSLSAGRRKNEVARFLRKELDLVYSVPFITYVTSVTSRIDPDGTGIFAIPSLETFERLRPDSQPVSIVFKDGSFLVVKEVVSYDFPSPKVKEPTICYVTYSFHYQRPQDCIYFRYDFHPTYGDPKTHPLHHVHAAGWQRGAAELPALPRLSTQPVTLSEVISIVQFN